ncbi:sporulation protein YqfD [Paenibacillus sp. ACRRX]|uniref:sporulation protein YqfD n=1 Tax=unclassified Paenibacillus TaxID=185978 RepID=UPI001EF5D351|nr:MULTISPECIES: sporulation protein YqfD [unclassified Paenibacillus]MCG7407846.1 sporulation protein YqfD [Paenibacillus sp. ACRRX]MDK8180989.1 sporulation protein YqfD [Paenibacillus sp. UMB4589-SE434]
MKPPALANWRGYVRVRIRGQYAEQLLNKLSAKQMLIWDVMREEDNQVSLFLMLPDFFRLRPLLKETGCRVHVEARFGVPFSIKQVRKRTFFISGLFLFLFGMYMLSSLIWTIDVKGNERIPTDDVLAAAREEGIYPFQWTFRMKKLDTLSKELNARLPSTSWIGVTRQGTRVVIHVVESTMAENRTLRNPSHLIARADAVVTQIIAKEGRAVVRPNTRVKKGSVLISGIVGSTQAQQAVPAKGVVRGLVWHEYEIVSPLISKQKVLTGDVTERHYIQIGERRLQVSGFGDIPYAQYEVTSDTAAASWGSVSLPLGWITEKIAEVQLVAEERSEQEAMQEGLKQARVDIAAKNGPDARVKTEKILHQKSENGKVKLKVLFEVEQSIAVEQPIIH